MFLSSVHTNVSNIYLPVFAEWYMRHSWCDGGPCAVGSCIRPAAAAGQQRLRTTAPATSSRADETNMMDVQVLLKHPCLYDCCVEIICSMGLAH